MSELDPQVYRTFERRIGEGNGSVDRFEARLGRMLQPLDGEDEAQGNHLSEAAAKQSLPFWAYQPPKPSCLRVSTYVLSTFCDPVARLQVTGEHDSQAGKDWLPKAKAREVKRRHRCLDKKTAEVVGNGNHFSLFGWWSHNPEQYTVGANDIYNQARHQLKGSFPKEFQPPTTPHHRPKKGPPSDCRQNESLP